MSQNFIEKMVAFLSTNFDIKFLIPEVRTLVTYADGTTNIGISMADSIYGCAKSKDTQIAAVLWFEVLDMLIDNKNPGLIGKSFRKKIEMLPKITDLQIMTAEIFRAMKIYRNAFVHNKQSFNSDFDVSYNFKGTSYVFKTGERTAIDIMTFIYLYATKILYIDTYTLAMLRGIYSRIKNALTISDEFGVNLSTTPPGIKLIAPVRYYQDDVKFEKVCYKLKFEKSPLPAEEIRLGYKLDYSIRYLGRKYRIPEEALDSIQCISVEHIEEWSI